MEARFASGTDTAAQGTFVDLQDGSLGVNCFGLESSAVTHASRSVKSAMTLTWDPLMTTAEVKFL